MSSFFKQLETAILNTKEDNRVVISLYGRTDAYITVAIGRFKKKHPNVNVRTVHSNNELKIFRV